MNDNNQLDFLMQIEETQAKKTEKKENDEPQNKDMLIFKFPEGSTLNASVRFVAPPKDTSKRMVYIYRRHNIKVGDKNLFFFCGNVDVADMKKPCPICNGVNGKKALTSQWYDNKDAFYKIAKYKQTYTWMVYVKAIDVVPNEKPKKGGNAIDLSNVLKVLKEFENTVKYITLDKDNFEVVAGVMKGTNNVSKKKTPIHSFTDGCDFDLTAKWEKVDGIDKPIVKIKISKGETCPLTADEIKVISESKLEDPQTYMESNRKDLEFNELHAEVLKMYDLYHNGGSATTTSNVDPDLGNI